MDKFQPQFLPENHYQFFGIDPQSYFSLKRGIKSVIHLYFDQSPSKDFVKNWKKLGFHNLIGKFNSVFYGQKIKKPVFCVYLSSKPRPAKMAFEAEKIGDRKTFGKLLGYPSCCVSSFMENYGQADRDLTVMALLATKTRASFYCNSIFNCESKLIPRELLGSSAWLEFWSKYQHLFLIKHLPHSFDCPSSINIGEITFRILKKELPDFAREIEKALKRPFLYFDYFNWLVFDGKVRGNKLEYESVLDYHSFLPKSFGRLVKKGNRLEVGDNKIRIFNGKKSIGEIKKDGDYRGILIDFQ